MNERSLILPAHDVRATLRDEKTQFRGLMRYQPPAHTAKFLYSPTYRRWHHQSAPWRLGVLAPGADQPDQQVVWRAGTGLRCPYGIPGDRLWVRETWRDYALSGAGEPWRIEYRAGGQPVDLVRCPNDAHVSSAPRWRSSAQMPRWASRLLLEVVSVRVERLQDITEEDARAEGAPAIPRVDGSDPRFYRAAFAGLWDSRHAAHAPWESNPWVWVPELKRVSP